MDFFDKMSETITNTSKDVAKKAKELAEITSLNSKISSQEEVIRRYYINIGKTYYQNFKENPDNQFSEDIEKISAANDQIAEFKNKIQEIKGVKTCTACSTNIPKESAFCPNCGASASSSNSGASETETESVKEVEVETVSVTETESGSKPTEE
jgi:hypothetical protein